MPRKKVIDSPVVTTTTKIPVVFIGVIVFAVIGIFVALFLGRTDSDAIDVSGVITTSNTAARDAGGEGAAQQSVSTHRNLPNGGLVGKGDEGGTPTPPVVEEVSSTTASTTPDSTEGDGGTDSETSEETVGDESVAEGEQTSDEIPVVAE